MGPKLQIEEPFLRNDFYKYEYEEALFLPSWNSLR